MALDHPTPRSSALTVEDVDEDEEAALKLAALQRLPTLDRLTASLLKKVSTSGRRVAHDDVDVRLIGFAERQKFIDQLLRVPEADNYKFLSKLRARLDRVGIELPTVEVRYENLTIHADTHLPSRALPTLLNTTRNIIEASLEKIGIVLTQKVHLTILNNISGIVRPGRLTLLLGPPNSGKTTFLLALAGKFAQGLKVKGKVTYNGHDLGEFVPQKTSAYISQNDLHMAEMTVRETLDFSARCQGVGTRYETLFEVLRKEKEAGILPEADIDFYMKATAVEGARNSLMTNYTLKILGLDICADIMVGDSIKRGISGGQKKRLTTGEIVVGPSKTLFMDEISNGLDTSTTFQIIKCLQQYVHLMEATIVMSLLQPAPEIFELFDDVILLFEGQIVYQGPREFILQFFEGCGFRCPKRKGIGDFLQEVTSRKDQEQYWVDVTQPYSYFTVKQFVDKFKEFKGGLSLAAQLSTSFDKSKNHKDALVYQKYSISKWELFKANWEKEVLLMKRHSFVHILEVFQSATVAFIGGTAFFRTHMHQRNEQDGQIYLAALFFCLMTVMFNGFSELTLTISRLSGFYKQRDLMFYPAWAFSIPSILLKVPISLLDSFIFTLITYYTIGYAPESSRFFKQYLIFFLVHQVSFSIFRAIAALSRTMIIANSGGSMSLLSIFVFGGYIIPRPKIPSWWIWGYWSSPLSYAQTAISVTEMQASRWMERNATQLDKNGQVLPVGMKVLQNRGLFTENYWYWISLGALLGFIILFNIVYTLALAYLNPLNKQQANFSKEQVEKQHAQAQAEPGNLKSDTTVPTGQRRALTECIANQPVVLKESADVELTVHREPNRGMILPFTPLSISFDEVEYSINMPSEMKAQGIQEDQFVLLRGVTGAFRPNVLTALVGVSGTGKTTLMDVLAGRKTSGHIKGDIRIAGFPKRQETFARISGYCEQNDVHSPQVTVYESLLFSASLRLPADIEVHTRKVFVDEVMELVELSPLRDALVGLPGVTGLSLEQRRRLSIAVELVANPSIIFMDEPTSGLDARAAAIVMRTVRNTVDTGRTVVCTIHQPSIDIFESFDELLLMKHGGQVIYAGPLGFHSHNLIEYFEAIPGVPPMKDGMNPSTWMLEISSQGAEARLGVDFAEIYRKSALYIRNKELVQQLRAPIPGALDLSFPTQFSQPFLAQFQACLWKQFWSYWRSPGYNLVRFMFTFVSALLFGTIFWQVGRETSIQQDLFNVMGAMFGATMFLGVNNSATVQPVVSTERTVFYRERGAGLYSPLAYVLAQVLIEIPFVLVQASYYALITYAMIGYEWEAHKFLWYFYVQFCTFLCFTYYGMAAVAITPSPQMAAIVASPFFSIFFLFSGFVIPRPRIPGWWQWFYWLCPISWTLQGLVTSQYGDLSSDILIPGEGLKPVKQYLDDYFGFKQSFLPVIGVVLFIMPMLFAFVVIVAFKKLNFQHR